MHPTVDQHHVLDALPRGRRQGRSGLSRWNRTDRGGRIVHLRRSSFAGKGDRRRRADLPINGMPVRAASCSFCIGIFRAVVYIHDIASGAVQQLEKEQLIPADLSLVQDLWGGILPKPLENSAERPAEPTHKFDIRIPTDVVVRALSL